MHHWQWAIILFPSPVSWHLEKQIDNGLMMGELCTCGMADRQSNPRIEPPHRILASFSFLGPWSQPSSLHLSEKPRHTGLKESRESLGPSTATCRAPVAPPMVPLRPVKNNSARRKYSLVVFTESTLLSLRLDHLHPSQQPVEPSLQSLYAQLLRPPHRQPQAHSARSSHRPSSLPPSRPRSYRPGRKHSLEHQLQCLQYHNSRHQHRHTTALAKAK
ncbi:hypothetical protein BGZ63DRAFT_375214 [Mariannaea sp. PMI_226]|nr:hypothetical protein BGZ63DRAFT_375214 [Mariannaea sp. PMI_226]